MNAAYLIGSLVGALVVVDGIFLAGNAKPLLPIPRWNYPRTPAALRLMGASEIIGGTGIASGFAVLTASGPSPTAAYIVMLGVLGQFLAYAAAWWVNHRARRPASN